MSLTNHPWIWREALKEKDAKRLRDAREMAERRARAPQLHVPPGTYGLNPGEERLERDSRGNEFLIIADTATRRYRRRGARV